MECLAVDACQLRHLLRGEPLHPSLPTLRPVDSTRLYASYRERKLVATSPFVPLRARRFPPFLKGIAPLAVTLQRYAAPAARARVLPALCSPGPQGISSSRAVTATS